MTRANLDAMKRVRRRDSENPLVMGGPSAVADAIDGRRCAWVTDGHILVMARCADADLPDGSGLWSSVRQYGEREARGTEMPLAKLRAFAGMVVWPVTAKMTCFICDGTGQLEDAKRKSVRFVECDACAGDGKVWPDVSRRAFVVKVGTAHLDRDLLARALACVVADDAEVVRVHAVKPLEAVELYGDGWRAFVMPMRWDGDVVDRLEV